MFSPAAPAKAICTEPVQSRATFFRWQRRYRDYGLAGLVARSRRAHQCRTPSTCKEQRWQVWEMRNRHPYMGKRKLRIMLQREGLLLSESTIGRILSRGRELGHIQPCSFCEGRLTARRRRVFKRHAKRWKYGTKAMRPGEFVQMDTMTIPATGIKEFKAVSPVDKFMVTRSYSRATARNAECFLRDVIDDLPYSLLSIQVDGGSEFMAEFEQACAARNIPLYVLPPRSPKLNGVVERANRTTRTEFWNAYLGELNLPAVNQALKRYQYFYNYIRPSSGYWRGHPHGLSERPEDPGLREAGLGMVGELRATPRESRLEPWMATAAGRPALAVAYLWCAGNALCREKPFRYPPTPNQGTLMEPWTAPDPPARA